MSVVGRARQQKVQQQPQQQFLAADGLAGYFSDDAGYREANAIRPVVQQQQPRLPNRVYSPEEARALEAQERARLLQEQMIMNEANRPVRIGR